MKNPYKSNKYILCAAIYNFLNNTFEFIMYLGIYKIKREYVYKKIKSRAVMSEAHYNIIPLKEKNNSGVHVTILTNIKSSYLNIY